MNWDLLAAGGPGTFHRSQSLPYQDAIGIMKSDDIVSVFLLDGCTNSPYSHVGAQTSSLFLARKAFQLVKSDCQNISEELFSSLLNYLRAFIKVQEFANSDEVDWFIDQYLLFTVTGYLIAPDITRAFICGDGFLMLNNFTTRKDQDNKPTYPGYCLLSAPLKEHPEKIPTGFDTWEADTDSLELIGLASDAFVDHEDLLNEAKRLQKSSHLQAKVNKWTEVDELLSDDTSITFCRRNPD